MLSRVLVFFAIVMTILGGLHLYLWLRLVRDTALPFPYRTWASATLVTLGLLVPLSFLSARQAPPALGRFLVWPGFVWLGLMFLLLSSVVALDLGRLLWLLGARARGSAEALMDPARRRFIARLLGITAAAAAGAAGAWALAQALRRVHVREVEVKLRRLPGASHGTTIVQLTDLHVGPTIGRAFVEGIVRQVNALRPDLIVLTGDLVDGDVETLADAVAPLAGLKARHGVYCVTGNHEYFSGVHAWIAELGRLGVRVLANERVAIGSGRDGFDLAGVHDFNAGRFEPSHKPDLDAALAGRDSERELVLLAHQPRAIHGAASRGVGLVLSGHTHGGQIWPFGLLVRLQQPYVHGLHRHGETETQIYVSAGTGYWGPPMRLRTRAEITRITLKSRDA